VLGGGFINGGLDAVCGRGGDKRAKQRLLGWGGMVWNGRKVVEEKVAQM